MDKRLDKSNVVRNYKKCVKQRKNAAFGTVSGWVALFHYPAFQVVFKRYKIPFRSFLCLSALALCDTRYIKEPPTMKKLIMLVQGVSQNTVYKHINYLVIEGFVCKEKKRFSNKPGLVPYVFSLTHNGQQLIKDYNNEFNRLFDTVYYHD